MSELLDAALSYAARGWPVFPLRVRGKLPIMSGGHHGATTDEQDIKKWWTRWPTANIGIPCGEKTFCVIDVDPDDGGEESLIALREEHGSVPSTLLQVSGRGGAHYCFLPDTRVGNSQSKLAIGIDTRGDNKGYIVAAPSTHENGNKYRWDDINAPLASVPDWLIPADRPVAPATPTAAPIIHLPGDNITSRARAYLRRCAPAVEGQGGHDKLLWAARAMVRGLRLDDATAYALLAGDYNPTCCPPWDLTKQKDNKDFRRKIEQARTIPFGKPDGWLLSEFNDADDRAATMAIEHGMTIRDALLSNPAISADTQSPQAPVEAIRLPTPTQDALPDWILQPTGLMGELCGWINSRARKKQPMLALANAFAFCGALFGRKIRDEWNLRTNLYCLGVGVSGCGKDHSRQSIKALCAAAGAERDLLGGEEATSDSALIACLRERPACILQWDEIGHMLANMKSHNASAFRQAIIPTLMKLYSSSGNMYLGKEYSTEERQDLDQPCCCLYGTTVPEVLWENLTVSEIRDGFLGRMLVFVSTDLDPDIDDVNSRDTGVPTDLAKRVSDWCLAKPEPPAGTPDIMRTTKAWQITIPTDAKGQARFHTFRAVVRTTKNAARQKGNVSEYLWNRAEENARKIALILAASDSMTNPVITEYHANYACILVNYLLNQFIVHTADNVAENEVDASHKRVLRLIKNTGATGVKRARLTQLTRHLTVRQRNEILQGLLEAGDIVEARKPNSKTNSYFIPHYGLKYINEGE